LLAEQPNFGTINELMVKERDQELSKVSFIFRDPPEEKVEEFEELESLQQEDKETDPIVEDTKNTNASTVKDGKPDNRTSAPPNQQPQKSQKANVKQTKLVNKYTPSATANGDQISDLKNIVKTLAENLQTEHVKVSNLERELFEKEGSSLLMFLLTVKNSFFCWKTRSTEWKKN
jgi:hypothetical protein